MTDIPDVTYDLFSRRLVCMNCKDDDGMYAELKYRVSKTHVSWGHCALKPETIGAQPPTCINLLGADVLFFIEMSVYDFKRRDAKKLRIFSGV